jgi:hypothetical protein
MREEGAFAGVHAATDTEAEWAFYKEVTGQFYDGHGLADTPGAILWDAGVLDHPAVQGLPNPWQLNEEWQLFNSHETWSAKPGFIILGRKQSDGQPIAWAREHDNYRSFYTGLGHAATTFQDDNVKRHLVGGIMWAVRRAHLIE